MLTVFRDSRQILLISIVIIHQVKKNRIRRSMNSLYQVADNFIGRVLVKLQFLVMKRLGVCAASRRRFAEQRDTIVFAHRQSALHQHDAAKSRRWKRGLKRL